MTKQFDRAVRAYRRALSSAHEGAGQRDVLVLATDGSREIPGVVYPGNDIAVGWTPDRKHLLFRSDRRGSMSL